MGIDWKKWQRMDTLTLGAGAALLAGVDPDRVDWRDDFVPDDDNGLKWRAIHDTLDLAAASYRAGKLDSSGYGHRATLTMGALLLWAKAKDLEVPAELSQVLEAAEAEAEAALHEVPPDIIKGVKDMQKIYARIVGREISERDLTRKLQKRKAKWRPGKPEVRRELLVALAESDRQAVGE